MILITFLIFDFFFLLGSITFINFLSYLFESFKLKLISSFLHKFSNVFKVCSEMCYINSNKKCEIITLLFVTEVNWRSIYSYTSTFVSIWWLIKQKSTWKFGQTNEKVSIQFNYYYLNCNSLIIILYNALDLIFSTFKNEKSTNHHTQTQRNSIQVQKIVLLSRYLIYSRCNFVN